MTNNADDTARLVRNLKSEQFYRQTLAIFKYGVGLEMEPHCTDAVRLGDLFRADAMDLSIINNCIQVAVWPLNKRPDTSGSVRQGHLTGIVN